ncbi:General secretion pathway protein M [Pseudohaliea rubra DSM 19751]|uniref:General secretion pathway protein M n=2 Tax=Pseudohaliea TaxID=1341120 RepID=A0A095VVI0_9GAMM|nr:General secretion pathway protein M [Pseudohaliea rubra DSM 19751]
MGLAVIAWAGWMLLWMPLRDARNEMALRNDATAVVLQRVDAMVSEILALRADGGATGQRGNLVSLINRSTAAAGLAVSRLQPNSRGEVQVRFEAAAFDDLFAWLHRLESEEGILVAEVAISRAGTPGRVNATVRLGQGA